MHAYEKFPHTLNELSSYFRLQLLVNLFGRAYCWGQWILDCDVNFVCNDRQFSCLLVCRSICLSVCLFVCLSVCLSTHVHQLIRLSHVTEHLCEGKRRCPVRQGRCRHVWKNEMAAALLTVLWGIQILRPKPAEERCDHSSQLDRCLYRWRPRACSPWVLLPWNQFCVQC